MIQLEQQHHGVGGWGGGLHQLPISSSLELDQKKQDLAKKKLWVDSRRSACAMDKRGPPSAHPYLKEHLIPHEDNLVQGRMITSNSPVHSCTPKSQKRKEKLHWATLEFFC